MECADDGYSGVNFEGPEYAKKKELSSILVDISKEGRAKYFPGGEVCRGQSGRV